MNRDRLINHILTLKPDTQAHVISAHLIELLETMRTEGRQAIVALPETSGQQAAIPGNVINVISVMANGVQIPQTLTDDEYVYSGTVDWGDDTYLTDADGSLLTENEDYIVE